MATLREIRRRIVGVKSTAKITQAMKMVAAAKLRRAQDAINAARPYSRALEALLKDLLRGASEDTARSPLLYGRKTEAGADRVLLIVVSSDRGLAGAFNSTLLKFTEARIRERFADHKASGRLSLITVGRRSTDYFAKRSYPMVGRHVGAFNKLDFSTAQQVSMEAIDCFNRGECDRVEVIFNEFRSIVSQRPVAEQFLPVMREELSVSTSGSAVSGPTPVEYIYEPDPLSILNVLVPKHLETMIWKALLESNAAEQGARMTAMDAATKNAKDLVSSLQLSFNKARQAAITKEILEIVGGAEALSQG